MLRAGDGPPPRHHRPTRQQAVDLVEDFSELPAGDAGNLADRDGGGFLELQLQFVRLKAEKGKSEDSRRLLCE